MCKYFLAFASPVQLSELRSVQVGSEVEKEWIAKVAFLFAQHLFAFSFLSYSTTSTNKAS